MPSRARRLKLMIYAVADASTKPGIMDCTQLIQALSYEPNENVIGSIWRYMVPLSPDSVACVCVLNACRSPSSLDIGMEAHDYISQNSLLTPRNKFDEQHMVLYTALLNMYRQCGRQDRVLSLWHENRNNTPTNIYIYSSLFSACADLRAYNEGENSCP
jgi:hypothetical protein